MNAERARLRHLIQTAEQEAARCGHAWGALTRQGTEQRAEDEQQAQIVAIADARAAAVRAEIAAPLIEQAAAGATAYLRAQERMWQANRAPHPAGLFGKRAAARTVRDATDAHGAAQDEMHRRWGEIPLSTAHIPFWAETITRPQVDADPRVIEAHRAAERAHLDQQQLTDNHTPARTVLL